MPIFLKSAWQDKSDKKYVMIPRGYKTAWSWTGVQLNLSILKSVSGQPPGQSFFTFFIFFALFYIFFLENMKNLGIAGSWSLK